MPLYRIELKDDNCNITHKYNENLGILSWIFNINAYFKYFAGNIMMFSYSVGMTTGSIGAYLLDAFIGPQSLVSECGHTVAHHAANLVAPQIPALLSPFNYSSIVTNYSRMPMV